MTTEISWALQILLQASPESLAAHRFEVLPALREILRRVLVSFKIQSRQSEQRHATTGLSVQVSNDADDFRTDLTRGTASACSETASRLDHSVSSLASDGDNDLTIATTVEEALTDDEATTPSDDSYKKFFKKIKKCVAEIEDISKRQPEDLITGVLATLDGEDGRLADIKQIAGKTNPSLEERLVQCLAQESIALEFTHWEQDELQVQQTRLDQLCCEPSSSQKKQTGRISQFVRHRFHDEEYSRKVIRYGLKQLVLKNRCQQELRCDSMGIDVGIASAYRTFCRMKYGQIPSFVLLLSTDGQAAPIQDRVSGNPPSTDASGHAQPTQTSVKDLLLGLSAWTMRCYNFYCEYRRSRGICLIRVFPSHKGKRRERSSRPDSAKRRHSGRRRSCHNDEDPSHSDAAGGLSRVHPGNLTSHGYQGPSGEQIRDLHQFAQRHADLTPRDSEHFTAPSRASYQDQRFSGSVVTQLQQDASLGATRLRFDEYPQPETSRADDHGIADALVAMRQHSYQPSNDQSDPSRWTPLHAHQPGPVSQRLATPDLANDSPSAIRQIAPQSLLPDPRREGMCNASAGMDQIAFQPLDLDLYENSIFNASLGLEQIATQPYVYESNGGGNMHHAHHDAATFLPAMDQVSAPEYHSNMQNAEYV